MSLTAPLGPISTAQELLRTTLADCYYFRTWQGNAYSQAQALARIYHEALPLTTVTADGLTLPELRALRPFVLVTTEAQHGFHLRHDASGTSFFLRDSGKLWLLFEQDVPVGIKDDPAEIDRRFKNDLGLMLMSSDAAKPGLVELAGQGDYLAIESISAFGPFRSAEDDQVSDGDCQQYYVEVSWGAGA